eukprot:TRINITY_DN16811_c2_g1_i2.p3 TRINITY_DN16811_c2_g1~~TRINITY_DN16811_c2_g1_i2.p3  ORF type:complete len:123 (+),score=17.35 TRINITY_DN16811_c2_g1_i2:3-371(+)
MLENQDSVPDSQWQKEVVVEQLKIMEIVKPYNIHVGDETGNQQLQERRRAVKEAMKHAWDGYTQYAWGYDELEPLSKNGKNAWKIGSYYCGCVGYALYNGAHKGVQCRCGICQKRYEGGQRW